MQAIKIKKESLGDILKASLYALIVSLISVLILGLIVKFTGMQSNVIAPINQGIKIISILIGCICGIKNREKGALKGGIVGFVYSILSFLIFSIINKEFALDINFLIDLIANVIAGVICGIICVNRKK